MGKVGRHIFLPIPVEHLFCACLGLVFKRAVCYTSRSVFGTVTVFMHILVFSKTGQVARALQDLASSDRGHGFRVTALGREAADLANAQSCARAIAAHGPDAVINAAAYTAVDAAETDEAQALLVNATAPAAMAAACAARDIPFVTISTDYVFDGTGTEPWKPADATGPLGAYGRTKLAGEQAVRAAGGRFAILRTSWVFSAHGQNFVKTMLRLGRTRDALGVVGDQMGGPTAADDIAAACFIMVRALADDMAKAGTYHFSGTPDVSWAEFATEIMRQGGLWCDVTSISTTQYPTPAARPLNSRLDCALTTQNFQIDRPQWAQSLKKVIAQLERN